MARLIKGTWSPEQTYGLPRRDQLPCDYEAYLPDPIAEREFAIPGLIAADLSDAERAVQELNQETDGLADTGALARLLLRTESVASSKIEGLEIGGRRLLKAQLAQELELDPSDRGAIEVLNNIEVMRRLVDRASSRDLTPALLLESHALLMGGTRMQKHGGRFRTTQNWIGGSEFNPCSAEFVPPPPGSVPELVEDLCEFCARDDLPAMVQAAIAHAQFETIHPFFDGNGRIGRAIIHAVLRRRGLAPRFVPPISLVLATRSREYIGGLTATRYLGRSDSEAAREGESRWLGTFAAATMRSIEDARTYDDRVKAIQEQWRQRLGRVRGNSAVDLLITALPAAPVISVKTAAELIGRSGQAVNQAIPRLVDAGMLKQTTIGRRNRAFEAPDLINAFNILERQLASPTGDTRTGAPVRPVPARP
jgi:Fic family protein